MNSSTTDNSWVDSGNIVRTDKNLSVKEFFIADDNNVELRRGQIVSRTAASGSYSTATSDYIIGITSLATAPTIGLPRPRNVGVGKVYIVKDEIGGAASTTITVRSGGEETIDGATTSTLTTNYQSKSFYTDGSNWFVY